MSNTHPFYGYESDRDKLQAENDRLRARVERLEKALDTLSREAYNCGFMLASNDMPHVGSELMNQAQKARKALEVGE